MAIHTGEPSHVGQGFVGLSVHRAARICSAAHGGQVLLSGTTRDLVEDHLPPGVALLDLGVHRLKDIDRPEAIFQLVIEGIPPVFTMLKTVEEQPTDATPFAGREEPLAVAAQAAMTISPLEPATTPTRRKAVARARALDWRQFIHLPGHSRVANRFEGLGFSIHSAARIAPRDDLRVKLRVLGRTCVTAARDARDADRLIRKEDRTALARQLAYHRNSAASDHQFRQADKVATQIAALDRLATARQQFAKEARTLEPKVRAIRSRVFDARLDPGALDDLVSEMQPLQEAAEALAASLHNAYGLASKAFAEDRHLV